jgi:GntR family transcriptional regulator
VIEYRIDRHSAVAPYMQIIEQTRWALRLGTLTEGDRLPTAKEVVASTAINPNTVFKAYRELEREGLVEMRRGVGTFVRLSLFTSDTVEDSPLRAALAAWMDRARLVGLEYADVEAMFVAVSQQKFPDRGQTR